MFSRINRLTCALLIGSFGLPVLSASDLLPIEPANTWRLKNAAAEFIMTVEEVTRSSKGTLARIRFQNPFADHSWLVLDDAQGVRLTGYVFNGVESYMDEPTPLFPANGKAGQVWTGPTTKVTQLSTGYTVTTPAGTFTGAVEFQIDFSDGSRQRWVLVPKRGFVATGDKSGELLLQSYRAVAATAAPAVTACYKTGISAIPADPNLKTADREAALAPVVRAGTNLMSVSIGWSELEPSPLVYSSARVRDELLIAAKNRMDVILNIRPVDNTRDLRPADLQGKLWNSTEVINRFNGALNHLLTNLPPEVKWINIGYEVDPFFQARPASETAAFLSFFQSAKSTAKLKTGRSVGIVFSFDSLRGNTTVYRTLEKDCDHVGFNYYTLRAAVMFSHRSTVSPVLDTLVMRNLARGRQFLIPEAGYASNTVVGAGTAGQSTFLQNVLTELRSAPGAAAVNIWTLNDMPEALVREAMTAYGVQAMPGSVEFLSSLGLRTSNGTEKAAMTTVRTAISTTKTICGL